MEPRRAVVVIGGALVVGAVIVFLIVRREPPDRVVLVGDSIAEEAAPYLKDDLPGTELVNRVYGGTAPCDWSLDELGIDQGDVAVVSFTGNSFTPCMSDGAGGHLTGDALVAKYAKDLRALVEGIHDLGADVLVVGQPARGPSAHDDDVVDGINEIYQTLADEEGVSYVDAGAAVETDDGQFAGELPCEDGEQECGANDRNPVRNLDGVHLCPRNEATAGSCGVYSSGAHRFAGAIADAVSSA